TLATTVPCLTSVRGSQPNRQRPVLSRRVVIVVTTTIRPSDPTADRLQRLPYPARLAPCRSIL
ncbi:MAG TPA: hypothetical protein VJ828_10385, partial [Lacipirellulaceae bacterium]|nr:hypothetical protein [Lacipirellulaceae bacterium]